MYSLIRILALIFTLFSSLDVWAWNAKVTHQDLSEKAAEYSVLSLAKGDYLKNLGFNNNLDEIFALNGEPEKIRYWIRYGSLEEDAGSVFTAYYYHHFHNPLALSWDQAGLNTIYPWINGESSLIWAQDDKQDITPLNPWRWQKAREYYHIALTGKDLTGLEVAPSKEKRDEYFAQTFKGLGHIIHLIQDAAQPAHVRNDPHPLDDYGIVPQFENWTKDPDNQIAVISFMANPVFPTFTNQRLTDFWDTNQYSGTDPQITANNNTIGLSEYTNANFFSEETIFSSFTYPRKEDTEYYEEYMKDWGVFKVYRKYLKKIAGGEQIQHFVYAGRLYKYLDASPVLQTYTLGLDEQCYNNYAQKLLPRAVGYSASLINYFFRGQINMEEDPNNSSLYIIKNEYNEDMSGTFTLYYDDINDNRRYLTSWNKSINPNSQSDSVYFTEPVSPEPKEKGKYILVFQGTLGNETSAVAGRVVEIEGCIEKGDVKIVVTADGILMQTNCRGELVKIGEISCMTYPGYERFLASLSKGNNQFQILTTYGQDFYLYSVELGDEIIVIGENRFRKIDCIDKQSFIPQSAEYSYGEPSKTLTGEGSLAGSNNCSEYTATATYTTSVMWTEAVAYQFYGKNTITGEGNYTDDLPFVFEKINWSAGS